ncbi:general secretion pathway protein I [Vibrio ishigakensis]|uniref:Type II secretion system protein I n=1 Tax=Vibrio ishigakensis TaxID=1481914 RepID=A0A0B8NQT3_9VIBR|nr:type II secretion system minor pseudopilin GspI [Vibrio ishigakensis]GAM54682.1 general secretion pathway protein I [Vibrio ishigakensis]GAM63849.1 general secretion pathway protein I [Vibrio ishigakensis]GAM70271.1 general secretion pathway protein I [Vibrio sp. JCM 19236]GAM77297.1 general secretion pathway protein I [Vibrio ishigakensis]
MKKRNSGMTLLEVLIALAIFATASISVIRAVTQHINSIGYLEQKTFAGMVADNQMAMVMLSDPITTTKKGSSELAGKTWYWQAVPVATANSYLRAIDVSVAENEDMKSPLVTVRSYVPQ